MTPKKQYSVIKTLTVEDSSWASKEGRVRNRIDWKLVTKIQVKFLKFRLMSTTKTTIVSQESLTLLYVIVKGLPIDVGAIIEREIRDCTMKKHKTTALLFSSLIIYVWCLEWAPLYNMSVSRLKKLKPLKELLVNRLQHPQNQLLQQF